MLYICKAQTQNIINISLETWLPSKLMKIWRKVKYGVVRTQPLGKRWFKLFFTHCKLNLKLNLSL